ncbi:MAG: FAD-binding protein [Candidatus Hodarchaeota archaeon]
MIETDVLIVGSGGAGLRAAIEAVSSGVQTIIVTKGAVTRSGASPLAGADVMLDGKSLNNLGYPGDPEDSPEKFFRDICIEGYYLNNQRLVMNYVQKAPVCVKELLDWGLNVTSSGKREIITPGTEIVNVLHRELAHQEIEIFEDTMVCELLTNKGRVAGAIAVDIYTGDIILFKAKSIVLATGGWQKAYPFNTIAGEMSGDGQAMAYRAGAELINMEMVTFCPNTLLTPKMLRGSLFFYALHASCGTILNNEETDILSNLDPKIVEIATKTEWNKLLLSINTMREVQKGKGSPLGGVYFSLKGISWEAVEKSPMARRAPNWKFKGANFMDLMLRLKEGASVEVGPAAHYVEGGIRVNERYETTLQGLYAAGECNSGTFGANRVSAATTEMLVEGTLAGRFAAAYAKETRAAPIESKQLDSLYTKLLQPLKREEGIKPTNLKQKMHRIAFEYLWVIRTGEDLKTAIKYLEKLRQKELSTLYTTVKTRTYNLEWIEALEMENMLQVLELSARTACMRTESRGVHYRLDYPKVNNDSWLKEIIVKQVNGDIPHFTKHPVVVTDLMLPTGILSFEHAILDAIERLQE